MNLVQMPTTFKHDSASNTIQGGHCKFGAPQADQMLITPVLEGAHHLFQAIPTSFALLARLARQTTSTAIAIFGMWKGQTYTAYGRIILGTLEKLFNIQEIADEAGGTTLVETPVSSDVLVCFGSAHWSPRMAWSGRSVSPGTPRQVLTSSITESLHTTCSGKRLSLI